MYLKQMGSIRKRIGIPLFSKKKFLAIAVLYQQKQKRVCFLKLITP